MGELGNFSISNIIWNRSHVQKMDKSKHNQIVINTVALDSWKGENAEKFSSNQLRASLRRLFCFWYFIQCLAEKVSRRLAILCNCVWLHSYVKIHLDARENPFRFPLSQDCTIIRFVYRNVQIVLYSPYRMSHIIWTISCGPYHMVPLFENYSIQNPLNIKRLVIDVIDILFDNIYFSQVTFSQFFLISQNMI